LSGGCDRRPRSSCHSPRITTTHKPATHARAAATTAVPTGGSSAPERTIPRSAGKAKNAVQALLDDSFRRESDVGPDDIAAIARYLIGVIANLAKIYDLKINTQYGAQLMLYIPRDHAAKIINEIRLEGIVSEQSFS
jgi:hypothetical protein